MKKVLMLLAIAVAAMRLSAAPVDVATAKNTAKQYMQSLVQTGKFMSASTADPVLVMEEKGKVNTSTPVFYIFNTSSSYVIVSADDRTVEVLGYGDKPLNIDRIPSNMRAWLDIYNEEIDYLVSNPDLKVEKPATTKSSTLRATTYGPLLTCKWDQQSPYNSQCKFTYNGTTYTCLTGCPATSASMVMYYWKYPTAATGTVPAYTSTLEIPGSSWWSSTTEVDYTYSALSSTTFDWDNMRDTYTYNYTTAQANAVATLMRYVGQAEQMAYGTEGSGIYTTETQHIVDMFTRFGYDESTCQVVRKSNYTSTRWANLLQEEMSYGRPVVYMAVDNTAGGHAFNVDGYDSSNSTYHVNFGWSGDGDGWMVMNSFGYDDYTFSSDQQMVIGIQPPGATAKPVISANPTSVTFSGLAGHTYTQTITVTGENLEGDITASISGNSAFTLDKTTITQSEATSGATLTIIYTPSLSGTTSATVTLSSSRANDVTISATGTAEATTPTLTVSETALEFGDCAAGTTVQKTFTVTGTDLTNKVILNLTDANGVYDISSNSFTIEEAEQGKVITVSFTPEEAYTYNASIRVTSVGATTQTITLSGTGTVTIQKVDPVMAAANEDYIQTTSFRADWSDETPAANVSSYTLWVGTHTAATPLRAVSEEGDATYRIITGITNKYYTVSDLTAGGTFDFKVKAIYSDNTESNWSNIQMVTLATPTPATLTGDVNLDGAVDVSDVNIVVNIILGNDDAAAYDGRADLNGDGMVDVSDVNALIGIVMGNS